MAYDATYMRVWRVLTGRTVSLSIPVPVLALLLSQPDARSVLHHHFGPDLCDAIKKASK